MSDPRAAQKRAAAVAAVQAEVRSGMVVGLGTGTTAYYVIEEIGRRILAEGLEIRGVPTSVETECLARARDIPLTDLNDVPDVDLDGADEIDPDRAMVKGAGGAMTREKCVANASRRLVIVADESKLVRRLTWPVPVEVLPFAEPFVMRQLHERFPQCRTVVRARDEIPFITDNGNHIINVIFEDGHPPAEEFTHELKHLTGVVEHGLFVGYNPTVYVASGGDVRVLS